MFGVILFYVNITHTGHQEKLYIRKAFLDESVRCKSKTVGRIVAGMHDEKCDIRGMNLKLCFPFV